MLNFKHTQDGLSPRHSLPSCALHDFLPTRTLPDPTFRALPTTNEECSCKISTTHDRCLVQHSVGLLPPWMVLCSMQCPCDHSVRLVMAVRAKPIPTDVVSYKHTKKLKMYHYDGMTVTVPAPVSSVWNSPPYMNPICFNNHLDVVVLQKHHRLKGPSLNTLNLTRSSKRMWGCSWNGSCGRTYMGHATHMENST